jgi:hypothetical protein
MFVAEYFYEKNTRGNAGPAGVGAAAAPFLMKSQHDCD